MSLPENGAAWPPPHMAHAYREMRLDDAWYAGDSRRLARLYRPTTTTPRAKPGFWGRHRVEDQLSPGPHERRLHVPLPGDIASTSADLLFADMPTITIPDAATDKATADRLAALLDATRMHHILLSAAEQAAALSGIYLAITWDKAVSPDRPIIYAIQPDNAIPEFRFGMLRAVNFWEQLDSDDHTVWRRIERHEPGRIVHALYEGTTDNIGHAVPLTEHPATRDLVDSLSADGVSIETGIPALTAVYVPNMLPNRLHRNSPMGRSDYAAPLHGLFDALDETWTSWMRDVRLARGRLIVPDAYLQNLGPGKGAMFDEDRDIWAGLKIPPTEQGTGITLAQFDIRVDEHQRTAEAITREAAQSAGYSAQTFGLDGGGQPITATESDSRDQRSMVTRKKKAGYWRGALADFLHALLLLDAKQFGSRITPARPTVEFGDGVAESEQQTATTLDLLNRAGAVSAATKVKILHPEWDDTAVQAEVAAILAETGAAAPDPVGNFPM